MTPVRLLGRGLCDRLRQSVATAIESWCEDWCLQEWFDRERTTIVIGQPQTPLWLEAKRNTIGVADADGAGAWLHLSVRDLRSMIGVHEQEHEDVLGSVVARASSLRDMLGAEDNEPGSETVRSVLLQAKAALLHSVVTALGCQDPRAIFSVPGAIARRDIMAGYAEVVVSDSESSFALLLPPALVQRLVQPRSNKPLGGLEARKEASLSSLCRVAAVLDLGDYPLPQLQQLRIGETLKSTVPLTQPFLLSTGASVSVPAFLGRVGERKAITLIEKQN